MDIKQNYPLQTLTTFHIGGSAKYFVQVNNEKELIVALTFARSQNLALFILGGGSNVLIPDEGWEGLVMQINLPGITKIKTNRTQAFFKVGAGVIWDNFVQESINQGYWGIENLSYIPGQTGSAIVQNIGAYGQEIKETVSEVEVIDISSQNKKIIKNKDCLFGYRQSIFNTVDKGKYVILNVLFRLSKKSAPNVKYHDLSFLLANNGFTQPNLHQIRSAIINLRQKKIPDPKLKGNAGSFFKNIFLSDQKLEDFTTKLQSQFAGDQLSIITTKLNYFKENLKAENKTKIPTGFLIEICGLKGKQIGGAKIDTNNALIIVNETGQASARDVIVLFEYVKQVIYDKCGIIIENEPTLMTPTSLITPTPLCPAPTSPNN
jgi:UDP-N-acetylmuramate dehydrogenase